MAKRPDKPVMLGARISPKAQYGLRLLARVQGRTIADAVEWSINLALRQTRIGSGLEQGRLAALVNEVWSKNTEAERVHLMHQTAPELLDFDERAAWNLVLRCDELAKPMYWKPNYEPDDDGGFQPSFERVSADDPGRDPDEDSIEFDFDLIQEHWPMIKFVGTELAKVGEIEMRFSLDEIIDGTALRRAGIEVDDEVLTSIREYVEKEEARAKQSR